jgi:phosphoheptose isomerase
MKYEDSYEKAFPFNKLIEGMLDPRMIEDTVQLIKEAIKREKKIAIIINNRAGGNAPLIVRELAKRFLEI